MIVTFFLSLPRSRTAWLSLYLTGMGVPCFHELWRDVNTIAEFKRAIEQKGPGPVANADCSNWFFVPELREAFPDAQFILIDRLHDDVWRSAHDAYGGDLVPLWDAYARVQQHPPPLVGTISFETWDQHVSRELMALVGPGIPFNDEWHTRLHQLEVQITPQRVAEDVEMGRTGQLTHLARRMTEQ